MLIIEQSRQTDRAIPADRLAKAAAVIPAQALRQDYPPLPEVSELQVVRHYSNLSRKNFSIDTQFYPLGSCTMKYNPKVAHQLAMLDGFLNHHPYSPECLSQGYLACAYDVQEMLKTITGMNAVSLACMAGAQGEFAGISMIRAYHQARGEEGRREILVPTAAHGTNPASAIMCGYQVKEIAIDSDGDLDIEQLKAAIGPHTAGIMLTNPSTLGNFELRILEIADIIHDCGALMYYDGANLNAILGKVLPAEMGFDVMHINLHKTFATPHGGGGPGAGPVAANARLAPFLPVPMVAKKGPHYHWLLDTDRPQTIGSLTTFMGNAGIILRAYCYMMRLGRAGLNRVADIATLNANYMQARLKQAGFTLAYPKRRASHEFIITFKHEKKQHNVTAMDIAKRLLDFGFHAPTTYFPLLIPECFLIEPTETESKSTIDAFIDTLIVILEEVKTQPDTVRAAPLSMPVSRLDDVKAARELDISWQQDRL